MAERKKVQKDCEGHYVQGDQCGLGFDPLLCAQDISEIGYRFRTEYLTEKTAVITYSWAGDGKSRMKPIASYILTNENEQWVLDGVSCLNGVRFNWPLTSH
jgi:hypothetical protein